MKAIYMLDSKDPIERHSLLQRVCRRRVPHHNHDDMKLRHSEVGVSAQCTYTMPVKYQVLQLSTFHPEPPDTSVPPILVPLTTHSAHPCSFVSLVVLSSKNFVEHQHQ